MHSGSKDLKPLMKLIRKLFLKVVLDKRFGVALTKNNKISKFYLILLSLLSLSFFLIIFLNLNYSPKIISNGNFEETNFKPNKQFDERIMKFYLLNNIEANSFVFGSSTSTVLDPELIKNYSNSKTNSLNLSFSGGLLKEYSQFLNWIFKNKSDLETIIVELKYYSLSEEDFGGEMPFELLPKNEQLINLISLDTTKKTIFSLSNKIPKFKKNKVKLDQVEKEYFYKGMRYYPEFFYRKNNQEKNKKHKQSIKSSRKVIFDSKILEKNYSLLDEIVENSGKNTNLIFYFGPAYIDFLKNENYKYLNRELKLIKNILEKTKIENIFYFNIFSDLNLDISYYESNQTHYDYDAGNIILENLLKNNNKNHYSYNFTKENFNKLSSIILSNYDKF
jgi:hypothetical protein